MKKILTFGFLSAALLFAGCSNGDSQKNFLSEDEVMPQLRPPAPVIDPGLSDEEFEKLEFLTYRMFGAGGKGETDDLDTIVKTHEVANVWNKKVKVNEGVYYIGGADKQVIIQTSTDWTGAEFILDDENPVNGVKYIFRLVSRYPPQKIFSSINKIERGQKKLDLKLEHPSFVVVTNDTELVYKRAGGDGTNNGMPLTDMVVLDRNGNVREDTPFIFDFKVISTITAYPIDEETMSITGGKFRTWGFRGPYYVYFGRGIHITRSNVVISGIEHIKERELTSSPQAYRGFILPEYCTDVLVKDVKLTGHNNLSAIGTYDIQVVFASNTYFKDCTQHRPSGGTWGIFASNNTKNITFDNVEWSRFDAHRGVYNVDIINSNLTGPAAGDSLRALGDGTLRVMNTQLNPNTVISLREDYGCSWRGDIIIKDVVFSGSTIMGISKNFGFDYGMPLYFAENIWIDNLKSRNSSSINLAAGYNYAANKDSPGGYKILPQKIYERDVEGTINYGNLAVEATILRKDAAGTVTVVQERNGDKTWNEPPPYKNPAVKFLPITRVGGTDDKPVYKYEYRKKGADYGDWSNYQKPDPAVFTDWVQD